MWKRPFAKPGGLTDDKADVDIEAPLKALAERINDTEMELIRLAKQKETFLAPPPPQIIEVAQELYVEIRGGKLHRQATRLEGTPPQFWRTTCGKFFAGSAFTFATAVEVTRSTTTFCQYCVGPARAAYSQVGTLMLRADVTV